MTHVEALSRLELRCQRFQACSEPRNHNHQYSICEPVVDTADSPAIWRAACDYRNARCLFRQHALRPNSTLPADTVHGPISKIRVIGTDAQPTAGSSNLMIKYRTTSRLICASNFVRNTLLAMFDNTRQGCRVEPRDDATASSRYIACSIKR